MDEQTIIDAFCIHCEKYFLHMDSISTTSELASNIKNILLNGWKMLFHIFVYFFNKEHINNTSNNNKLSNEFHINVQQSYLLYREYIEQTFTQKVHKNMLSPVCFVYDKLLIETKETILENSIISNKSTIQYDLFHKIKVWSDIIVGWKIQAFSNKDRIYLISNITRKYLSFFIQSDYFEYHNLLNFIQDKWNKYDDYNAFEDVKISLTFYTTVLEELYQFIYKNQRKTDPGDINQLIIKCIKYDLINVSNINNNKTEIRKYVKKIFTPINNTNHQIPTNNTNILTLENYLH